jgi:hypothetical protein
MQAIQTERQVAQPVAPQNSSAADSEQLAETAREWLKYPEQKQHAMPS